MSSTLFKIRSAVTVSVLLLLFTFSCAPRVLNDFFGIEMDPAHARDFKIVSYSDEGGARYRSDLSMNPLIYAYAGLGPNSITLKVVNTDTTPVKTSYNLDRFILVTKTGEEYHLLKGNPENYPDIGEIAPGQSVEYHLELPSNFWATIGMTKPDAESANYTKEFWKGENNLRFVKENIRYIEVVLGGETTFVLKPIMKK